MEVVLGISRSKGWEVFQTNANLPVIESSIILSISLIKLGLLSFLSRLSSQGTQKKRKLTEGIVLRCNSQSVSVLGRLKRI